MKMIGMALGLVGFCLVGSLAAQQENPAVEAIVAQNFGAAENEIKRLFVQAKEEGWSAEQFASACVQLAEQRRSFEDDQQRGFEQQIFMISLAGAALVAGLIVLAATA